MKEILEKHGWKYLGTDMDGTIGFDAPTSDLYVCSFKPNGEWEIVFQWTGPNHLRFAHGNTEQTLDLSLSLLDDLNEWPRKG